MWRIGLDIGGTKIEALAMRPDGSEAARRRMQTPRGDYDATIAAIASLVSALRAEYAIADLAAIGAGIPGSISPKTGLVRNANSTWLNGQPFKRDLESALELAVFIENDANCLALSEAVDGAGAGYKTVFAVILGTGVGGGLTISGGLVSGLNAVGGEWGHNPLPWPDDSERDGAECFCGKRGCIETFLSGPALERQFAAASGLKIAAAEIADLANAGDATANQILDIYCGRLARALATVVNIVDTDVIVFGGGLSNVDRILTGARAQLPHWVFSDVCETEFRRSRWGDSSGVRGAARLVDLRPIHPV